jgi:hypothetical protein
MSSIKDLFPIDVDNDGAVIRNKINELLISLCYTEDQDIKIRFYSMAIMATFREYEINGLEAALRQLDQMIEKPALNDNSDIGFPVKLETDEKWPGICKNDCPFDRECANAGSAGDYRSESGLTPDFVKNEDSSITCHGCGDMEEGMRLFDDNGRPTTFYKHYNHW